MKIISLVNQKGGVAKTTSTQNIGVGLAQLGKKVLLIDFDPQGNLTTGFKIDKTTLNSHSYHLIMDEMIEVEDVIHEKENLHVIPTNSELGIARVSLVNELGREQKLKEKLEELDNYDYILIDCPPSLDILSINAMIASDYLVIPVKMEQFAFDGLSELQKTFGQVKKLNKNLEVLGAFATEYDKRISLTETKYNEMKEIYKEKTFNTFIPTNSKIKYSQEQGLSVISFDKSSTGAKAYVKLAKEIIERCEV